MQYPYITFIEIITIILTLFIGLAIFHFLIKKWQKSNFLTTLKAFILYIIGGIFVYLIYPFYLLVNFLDIILVFLIYRIILFLIFYFIVKKIILINWKKALISFLLIIMIILPTLSIFRTGLVMQLTNIIPIVKEERMEVEGEIMKHFKEHGAGGLFDSLPLLPPTLRLAGGLERATLSWPRDYFRLVILSI